MAGSDPREYNIDPASGLAIITGATYVLPVNAPRDASSTLDLTTSTKMTLVVKATKADTTKLVDEEILYANFDTKTAALVKATFTVDAATTATIETVNKADSLLYYWVALHFSSQIEPVIFGTVPFIVFDAD